MVNTTASAPSVRIGPTRWTGAPMPETAWWLRSCWCQQRIRYVLCLCHQVAVLPICSAWQCGSLSCASRDSACSPCWERKELWTRDGGVTVFWVWSCKGQVVGSQTKRVFKGPVRTLSVGLVVGRGQWVLLRSSCYSVCLQSALISWEQRVLH